MLPSLSAKKILTAPVFSSRTTTAQLISRRLLLIPSCCGFHLLQRCVNGFHKLIIFSFILLIIRIYKNESYGASVETE